VAQTINVEYLYLPVSQIMVHVLGIHNAALGFVRLLKGKGMEMGFVKLYLVVFRLIKRVMEIHNVVHPIIVYKAVLVKKASVLRQNTLN
jgi:hypothetical protein